MQANPCYPVLAILDGIRVPLGNVGRDLLTNFLELIARLVEGNSDNEGNRANKGENPEEPEHGAIGFYEAALADDSTNETGILVSFPCARLRRETYPKSETIAMITLILPATPSAAL